MMPRPCRRPRRDGASATVLETQARDSGPSRRLSDRTRTITVTVVGPGTHCETPADDSDASVTVTVRPGFLAPGRPTVTVANSDYLKRRPGPGPGLSHWHAGTVPDRARY
jgi:hypothetical protein